MTDNRKLEKYHKRFNQIYADLAFDLIKSIEYYESEHSEDFKRSIDRKIANAIELDKEAYAELSKSGGKRG